MMPVSHTIKPNDGKPLSLRNAFIRRTNLDRALLIGTNLSAADMTGVSAKGADFRDAILEGTILNGANLSDAKNLTLSQLARAVIDSETVLPEYIDRSELTNVMIESKD